VKFTMRGPRFHHVFTTFSPRFHHVFTTPHHAVYHADRVAAAGGPDIRGARGACYDVRSFSAELNTKAGHMSKEFPSSPERRSFFTRLNAGAASLAAIAAGGVAMAREKSKPDARWEPARHEKDDWLDKLPGKHRLVFDTTTPNGFGEAMLFANNYLGVNQKDYGLKANELALVIVARHQSTPFGYNDAMWAKYGEPFAAMSRAEDPKTKAAPKVNIYNSGDYANLLPSRGVWVESLQKQGVQLAVCSVATRAYAGNAARATGANVDAIFDELVANLVGNARMVPAGIVAVNRAQERGYSLVTA
jgi:intracellular sulfur oxidation DsrE/DsrF family protein